MNVRLNYSFNFTAGVYFDKTLHMNNYHVKLWMLTNTADAESHNIAFERIRYFTSYVLESAIFVNSEYSEIINKLDDPGIKLMTMPEDPVDQVIGIMLFSKFGAIMEDRIILEELEISSELGANMVYLHGSQESKGRLEQPGWWNDPGIAHSNRAAAHTDKIMNLKHSGTWRDVELHWPEEDKNKDTGNTIVFADFGRNENK